MQKFDTWNDEKKILNNKKRENFYINPREIWYTKMGINIGFEENGKENFLRPVLVLKIIGTLIFTVALTTKGKKEHWFYHKLEELDLNNPKYIKTSFIILSQVKVMDKNRFFKKGGILSKKEFLEVQKKIKRVLF